MASTWPEDGVDDSGERMYLQQQQNTINSSANDFTANTSSKLSTSSSPPSSTAALKFFSRNIMLASASNHNASSSTIGRQRQVQHLREVHRLKMETLKNERPEGTENDNQDSSDDDDDADISSKKIVKFPLAHKNLTQDTDDTAFLKMVRSTKSTSSSAATKSGKNNNRRKELKNENADNDVLVDAFGSDSSCESENSFRSNEATPSDEDLNNHQGTTATTKQVTFATSVGNNKTQQMQQSRQNHHHHHQQSNFSGSSQISSSEAATPSILDIGSDKMPLRFFPDQRTTSGWRGVVRPTGGGMLGYHHLKNQIARNQQQQSAQQQQQEKQGDANKPLSQGDASASSTTTVSTSNVNLQGSVAKSTVVSNFVNNNHKINNNNSSLSSSSPPKTQNQIRASTPTQQKSSNATSTLFSSPPSGTLAGRNTPNPKNRVNLPPMSPTNNMTNRNSPSNSTRQQSKSLVKDHLTVFNTFREPIPVPNSHKHRNANPTQESITKALPTPKSDVDVAVLAPRSSKFVAGGTKNNKLIIRNSSKTNNSNGLTATTHGNSSASSSMRSTYNNNNNNNDIIADVRLVILDDIHQNLHRAVSRQMEYSPQRLPRKRQETAKILPSSSSPKNPRKNSNRNLFSDYDAAENDHNNFASSTTTTTADANLSTTTNKPNPKKSSSSPPAITAAAKTYVDDSDDDDLLLMQGGDFVSIADEKVVVGGDVVGGDPLLLPKMRGRWDAMRDAIKARYFAKEAPPVEPIAHALRHLPLPELCSMYRRAVKEVKGALEMTRRIFDSLVKVMLRTLPGNPTVTEDEVTKMYYVFDMNGNGSISFIEFLTTVVDFQTDRKETNFLRQVFNNLLLASDQKEAVATEDLSARAPWKLLEDGQVLFDAVLKALDKSYRFPRVVEKTFCDVLASSMLTARKETESALCQESYDGLFWEQFRLLVCLDPELMIPLRTIKLREV